MKDWTMQELRRMTKDWKTIIKNALTAGWRSLLNLKMNKTSTNVMKTDSWKKSHNGENKEIDWESQKLNKNWKCKNSWNKSRPRNQNCWRNQAGPPVFWKGRLLARDFWKIIPHNWWNRGENRKMYYAILLFQEDSWAPGKRCRNWIPCSFSKT